MDQRPRACSAGVGGALRQEPGLLPIRESAPQTMQRMRELQYLLRERTRADDRSALQQDPHEGVAFEG